MADTQDSGRLSGFLGSLRSAFGRLGGRSAGTGTPEPPAPEETGAEHHPVPGDGTAVPVPEELAPPAPAVRGSAAPEPAEKPVATGAAELAADSGLEPIAPEDVPVVGAETVSAAEAPSALDQSPFVEAPGDPVVDASWTVARLRTLARERGVRGYSSMSKAQLLGELSSPQA